MYVQIYPPVKHFEAFGMNASAVKSYRKQNFTTLHVDQIRWKLWDLNIT